MNCPFSVLQILLLWTSHNLNFIFYLFAGMDNPGEMSVPEGLFDTNRIHYYKGYITQMKKAMNDGVNVIGYFAWSILDNFEWRSGFTARFGIVYIDWERNLTRIPKLSAYWFKQILDNQDDHFN